MTGVFPRSNYVVTARFVIRKDSVNNMRVVTHDLTSTSRAEQGCILYHFSESTEKEGIFSLYMIWRDEMAYRNYAGSPFVRAFNSILSQGMLTEPPIVETWRSLG
jgi:quinol monooxygenase YgiN